MMGHGDIRKWSMTWWCAWNRGLLPHWQGFPVLTSGAHSRRGLETICFSSIITSWSTTFFFFFYMLWQSIHQTLFLFISDCQRNSTSGRHAGMVICKMLHNKAFYNKLQAFQLGALRRHIFLRGLNTIKLLSLTFTIGYIVLIVQDLKAFAASFHCILVDLLCWWRQLCVWLVNQVWERSCLTLSTPTTVLFEITWFCFYC